MDAVFERTLREFADGSGRLSYISGPDGRPLADGAQAIDYMLSVDRTGHITPNAVSFTKSSFFAIGRQDERLRYGEDGEFLLRMAGMMRVAMLAGKPVAVSFTHGRDTTLSPVNLYAHNILGLQFLYDKLGDPKLAAQRSVIRQALAGKLDYVLTCYGAKAENYIERLRWGAKALRNYPMHCLTWSNVKSIAVWLTKPHNSANAQAAIG